MKTILVIEDEKPLLKAIETKLRLAGFEVLCAETGEEGLEQLKKNPDLVWLDIYLPKMDGFGFLQAKNKLENKIPVLVVSNSGSEEKIRRASNLGVTDYLVKANFSLEEIIEKIKMILRNNGEYA